MALKVWAELMPEARLNASGCPDPVIEHYLRAAAIDLCARSKALTFEMPAFDTVAGNAVYALAPAAETQTVQIAEVTVNGTAIDPIGRDELAQMSQRPGERDTPTRFMMYAGDRSVLLWKTPDGVYSVVLTLAVKPSLTATGIEAWFSDAFGDVIIAGALAALLALPGRSWTSGDLSSYHKDFFESGVIKARAFAEKDGARSPRAPLRTTRYGRF